MPGNPIMDFIEAMHRMRKIMTVDFPRVTTGLHMNELFAMKDIEESAQRRGRDIYASEIKSHMRVSRPAVSKMLNSLERKGYIERRIDSTDRRKISVALTDLGRRVVSESKRALDEVAGDVISRYGEDEYLQLVERMNRLADTAEAVAQERGGPGTDHNPKEEGTEI